MKSSPRCFQVRRWMVVRGCLVGVGWVVGLSVLNGGGTVLAQFPDAPREPMPPLDQRRLAVLKEFDRDQDGRLDVAERETARKAWAAKKLAEREDRGFFGPPPEIVAEFDTNQDGQLDEDEGRIAGETLGRRFEQMRKDYDRNGNGRLDEDEIATAIKDVDSGKLKGIPRMLVQFAAGRQGRRGGGRPGGPDGPGESRDTEDSGAVVREADKDHDGRLSAAELEVVRAAYARRRAASSRQNGGAAPAVPAVPNPVPVGGGRP